MLSTGFVIAVTLTYLIIIVAVGFYAHRMKALGKSITSNPMVYSLSIAVYTTTWTFYGSIGKAATTGIDFLLIYLGPSLVAFSWWFILRKTVRIAKENNITSIADFISSRYGKSQLLGALVTIIALLGIMPYIALQLKAIATSFAIITGSPDNVFLFHTRELPTGLLAALVLCAFSIMFGARNLVSSERHEGLMAALTLESLVKLGAFLLVGGYIVYGIFDGITDIFLKMKLANPQLLEHLTTFAGPGKTGYATVTTMLFLSICAVMLLPRQFHAMVIENSAEEHIRHAMWRFPLYLFLINIFVMPIALAGILLTGSSKNADFFILTIPLNSNHPWLALVAFIGGFSAAAGMVMVESIAISTMFLNHILMPIVVRLKPRNWFPFLLINLKRIGIIFVIFLGYFYQYMVGETFMLVNMGLISFAAAAQFAPAMIGALYWKRGNATGAIFGTTLGFVTWAYTLLLPSLVKSGWFDTSLIDAGPFGIGLLKPTEFLGLSGFDLWTHSLFWSLFFNVAAFLICSILVGQTDGDNEQARKFVDVFVPQETTRKWERKRLSKPVTVMQLVNLMSKFIGEEQAHAAISDYIGDREIDEKGGVSEFEMPNLKRFVEKTLAGSVGSAAAGAIVESYLSGIGSQMESFYDVFSTVRTSLAESREALYVRLRASELINRNLDLQIILDDILDLLKQEFKFDFALIRLCDNQGKLAIKAKKGISDDSLIASILSPEITSYIGDAFLSNKPQFINDTRNMNKPQFRDILEKEGVKSFAHIPLSQAGENPVGVLSVFSRSIIGVFTEPFVQLLSSLAGQLAQEVRIVNEKSAREKERLQKERALLENARVSRDMELAKQIQLSLLPSRMPENFENHMAARCIPATHIGGDYYDFFLTGDERLNIVIADVSGHSVGAALIMVETRSVFRMLAMSAKTTSTALTVLNRQLYEDLSSSELFLSMFYVTLERQSRKLSYSSAGHNHPFLLRNGSNDIIELDAEGLIIGVKEDVIFEQKEIDLLEGDLFVMYTDGVVEAENIQQELFGNERFSELLLECRDQEPDTIINTVLDRIRTFTGGNVLADDVSLVILRIP